MALVIVKSKYQVVIPQRVREQVGVAIGDVLEAKAVNGRIVLEPKSIVDRGIAESIAEFKAGHAKGPFRKTRSSSPHCIRNPSCQAPRKQNALVDELRVFAPFCAER